MSCQRATILTLLLGLAGCQVAEVEPALASECFLDDLQPYGEWIEHERHGRDRSPDPAVVGDARLAPS